MLTDPILTAVLAELKSDFTENTYYEENGTAYVKKPPCINHQLMF